MFVCVYGKCLEQLRRGRRSSRLPHFAADHFLTSSSVTFAINTFRSQTLCVLLHLPRIVTMSAAASRCATRLIQRSMRPSLSISSPLRSAIPQSSHQSTRVSIASTTRFPSTRPFSSSSSLLHGHLDPPKPGEERKVTFIDKEGDEHTFVVADGDNLLDIGVSLFNP